MLNSIVKTMNDYGVAYGQVNEVYMKAKQHCDKTFVPSSSMYKNTLETAQNVRRQTLMPLAEKHKADISKAATGARNALQRIITMQPTEEQIKMIQLVKTGSFTDTEKALFLDSVKGNYLASKLMHQAMNLDFTMNIEHVLEDLDFIEQNALNYFGSDGTPSNSYNSRLMIQGDFINRVNNDVNSFISTFSEGTES